MQDGMASPRTGAGSVVEVACMNSIFNNHRRMAQHCLALFGQPTATRYQMVQPISCPCTRTRTCTRTRATGSAQTWA